MIFLFIVLIIIAIAAAIFAMRITQHGRQSSFDRFDRTMAHDFGERDPFTEEQADVTGDLLRRFISYAAWLLVAALVISAIVVLVTS
jgi:hypothetical protein